MAQGRARLLYQLSVEDPTGVVMNEAPQETRWAVGAGAGLNGTRQTVTLAGNAFTAITVPNGTKFVALILGAAVSLVLKGITGDTGIALTPTSNPINIDALFPVGASPSLGILNNSATTQTIEVILL